MFEICAWRQFGACCPIRVLLSWNLYISQADMLGNKLFLKEEVSIAQRHSKIWDSLKFNSNVFLLTTLSFLLLWSWLDLGFKTRTLVTYKYLLLGRGEPKSICMSKSKEYFCKTQTCQFKALQLYMSVRIKTETAYKNGKTHAWLEGRGVVFQLLLFPAGGMWGFNLKSFDCLKAQFWRRERRTSKRVPNNTHFRGVWSSMLSEQPCEMVIIFPLHK